MQLFKKEISLKQAALISGYTQDYLGFLIRSGEMKGVKKGGIWFTTKGEVKRYIITQKNLHKTSTKELVIKKFFSHIPARNILVFTFLLFIGFSSFAFRDSLQSTSGNLADGWSTFTNELIDNSIDSFSSHKQFADNANTLTRSLSSALAGTIANTKDLRLATTASVGDSLLGVSNGISDGWGIFINGLIDSAEKSATDTKKLATSLWSGIISAPNNIISDWNSYLVILSQPKIITVPIILPPSLVTTTPIQTPPSVDPLRPSGTSPLAGGGNTIIKNIIQQQRDIYINQYDPSILSRLQGVELALQNSISHNTNQTDRTYDSVINSINSASNNITLEGILNKTTLRTPLISNGTLSGNTTIGLVEAPGTLTIYDPTTLNNNISQVGSYTFSTGTGAISLNGDVTITANNNFIQTGTGSFSTGTGPISLNGATTANTFSSSGATITGGSISGTTINNSTIGITIPVAGNFTTIGATTTGSGAFTTLTASTSVFSPTFDTETAVAMNIGTATQNALTLGRVGATTTINGSTLAVGPTAWTASPTISGLATFTSGLTSTGALIANGTSTFGGNILASTGNINIGSSGTPFGTVYSDSVIANNIYGTMATGSTSSDSWIINSDNATADTQDMNLSFERGTSTPNALLTWDATNKKFTMNGPLELTNGIGTATFTSPGLITGQGGANISGGDLTLGANNINMTGSLGSTLARLTSGWFTDLAVSNSITTLAESWMGPSSTTGIYFKGGKIGIGNNNPLELLSLGTAGVTGGLFSLAGSSSGKLTIQPSANAGDYTLTLPTTAGTNGFYLKTDGTGNLSWGDLTYTNANPMPNAVGGLPAGSTLTAQTIQSMFDKLLYPYIAPTVSVTLNPTSGTVREFGNPVASPIITATTTKRSNNITLVEFYRGGILIHTQASPIPGGGAEVYTDTTPVTTNGVSFTATAGDGTQTTTSGGVAYTFVYPFYSGVGAQGLTGADIRSSLTKTIKLPSNTTLVSSPSNQVFYIAYPNTSPVLTSILDTNGFETLSDYTFRTVSITGLDGTSQTYKVYEYKNLTTQSNFTNQFKF